VELAPHSAVPARLAGRARKNLKLAVDLYRLVKREKIDVIHAHNYEAPLLAYVTRWLTGVPVVYHAHNALSDELATYVDRGWMKAIARRLGRWLDRHVPRRADFAIALTGELERFLLSCGVAPDRVSIVPPSFEERGRARLKGERDGSRFVVAYAGNLDAYQDLDVLIQGFVHFRSKAQNAILAIITHEIDWRRRAGWLLEELVAQGAAQVAVLSGFADASEEMRRADVLVCPRSSWSGYPIKLLNYRAAGRPIVAAAGSAKGICDGVDGLIFRNGDPRHLAEQLDRLYEDLELRGRLAACALERLRKNHDPKKIASEIERIHARLGSRRSSRGSRSRSQGKRVRRLLASVERRIVRDFLSEDD
jgi:glycosyltransferase involved in cell wall biosynthesis